RAPRAGVRRHVERRAATARRRRGRPCGRAPRLGHPVLDGRPAERPGEPGAAPLGRACGHAGRPGRCAM
ncbi:MAG: hypothetical protein AVDCRST_MAG32-1583, partial [uncultured Nocardioides sp.]